MKHEMQQILKRLEIIKSSISLEDEEIIQLQVSRIQSGKYDAAVADILSKLLENDFANAVKAIDAYINSHTGLMPYEDKEIQGLRLELKVLERKLQNLTEKKNDYASDIDDFNREYSLNLGEIIQQILSLREELLHYQIFEKEKAFQAKKEKFAKAKEEVKKAKKQAVEIEEELEGLDELSEEYDELYGKYENLKEDLNRKEETLKEKRKETKQAKEDLESDSANTEYQEAKEDAETFEKEYEKVVSEDIKDLDESQLKELKKVFRQACRLCHPDIVAEELKQQAHHVMSELNIAYKKKDLDKVKEILLSLQSGEKFEVASDTIQDRGLLERKITNTKKKIDALEAEINELIASDDFNTISNINDKTEYFAEIRNQLEEELDRLKEELNQLKDTPDDDWQDEF